MPSIINSDDGVVSGTSGLKTTGGNDGLLNIQTNGTNAISISSGQRSTFPTTIGVGGATPSTSGSGISFPATQSASTDANTLDDYEEGTFTFTLTGSTAAPSTPQTTTGYYTKIGRFVTVSAYFVDKNLTGATGTLKATGLPFTSSSDLTNRGAHTVALFGFTFTGSLYVDLASSTEAYFQESRSGTSWAGIAVSAASGKYVQVTINYMTS